MLPPPFIGLGPRDSLRIEYPAIELASEGLRIRLGPLDPLTEPLTGVPLRLGGPLIDAGLPTRGISPPTNPGNLRSSS